MKSNLRLVYNSDRVHVSENGTPIITHTWGFSADPTKEEAIAEAQADIAAYAAKLKEEGFEVEVLPDIKY